jgi:hypothetical protein
MTQNPELLTHRADHFGVTVAQAHSQDSAEKVEVLYAIGIGQEHSFAALQHQRLWIVVKGRRHHILVMELAHRRRVEVLEYGEVFLSFRVCRNGAVLMVGHERSPWLCKATKRGH